MEKYGKTSAENDGVNWKSVSLPSKLKEPRPHSSPNSHYKKCDCPKIADVR